MYAGLLLFGSDRVIFPSGETSCSPTEIQAPSGDQDGPPPPGLTLPRIRIGVAWPVVFTFIRSAAFPTPYRQAPYRQVCKPVPHRANSRKLGISMEALSLSLAGWRASPIQQKPQPAYTLHVRSFVYHSKRIGRERWSQQPPRRSWWELLGCHERPVDLARAQPDFPRPVALGHVRQDWAVRCPGGHLFASSRGDQPVSRGGMPGSQRRCRNRRPFP